jgi:hypothetical protein
MPASRYRLGNRAAPGGSKPTAAALPAYLVPPTAFPVASLARHRACRDPAAKGPTPEMFGVYRRFCLRIGRRAEPAKEVLMYRRVRRPINLIVECPFFAEIA